MTDRLRARAIAAAKLRAAGWIYREIGSVLGVSMERARQLVKIGQRIMPEDELFAKQASGVNMFRMWL